MNQIVVAPEVLERFHELAETTHRDESEIINEALSSYLVADRRYAEILTARMTAADRGEFASDEAVVDAFLETLNPADEANAAAWLVVARRRLDDLDSGRVKAVPGEEVFERVRQRQEGGST